ncbi:FAD-binding protein [Neomegalonema sp.]|uniref:FAD-binding protein n=1 Tax=Neomegalonema sp. TaxID=2039713 RepID=UPI002621D1EB|nr:FAD-binding protein [Neomegalonema sp.]MDD2867733.1 FAD-binding protein [Neomegalonema sp.]
MGVLLLAELSGSGLARDATAKALAAARALGPATVLVAGQGVAGAAAEAAKLEGVARVLLADDPLYAHGLPEPLAALLIALAPGYGHILAPATATTKSALPRAAALLDVMIIPDVVSVESAEVFVRPVYAGAALQTLRSGDPVKILTIRTAAFQPVGESGASAPVEAVAAAADPALSTWVKEEVAASDRPELAAARVVVSGGRGVGSQESFRLIEALADKLGAAVGASRAAVDSGYAPNDLQVGQTGKVVAPELYIAVGISGAIQHLAGMKDSKVIVAINKDEEAPIFQVADYGLVGDLFALAPELTKKL